MTRYGLVVRRRSFPRQVHSEAAQRSRASFGLATQQWRALTDTERAAWGRRTIQASSRSGLEQSRPLSGHALYVKINCARASIGLDQFDDPPKVPEFSLNPVGELTITNTRGVIALKLDVPSAPAKHTVLYGAAPCSAGKYFIRQYNILGLLPEPVRGVSDITALYVARYGVPPAGTRVCVRTQQHINGWDDLPKQTSAVVPKA